MSSPSDPAQATAQTRPRVTISGQLTRTGAQPVATPVASPAPTRPVQTVTLAPAADPSTLALVQARRLGGQGRYHEAEQVLLRAMASDPASVPVRRYLATVFLALAKNREAHAMLKAMVQQLPDDEPAAAELFDRAVPAGADARGAHGAGRPGAALPGKHAGTGEPGLDPPEQSARSEQGAGGAEAGGRRGERRPAVRARLRDRQAGRFR